MTGLRDRDIDGASYAAGHWLRDADQLSALSPYSGQRPHRVDVIRQHHDSIDGERVTLARLRHGSAQRVDVIDEQSLSTLKKIDREEPAPTGHECTTIIWHSCMLAILCGYM